MRDDKRQRATNGKRQRLDNDPLLSTPEDQHFSLSHLRGIPTPSNLAISQTFCYWGCYWCQQRRCRVTQKSYFLLPCSRCNFTCQDTAAAFYINSLQTQGRCATLWSPTSRGRTNCMGKAEQEWRKCKEAEHMEKEEQRVLSHISASRVVSYKLTTHSSPSAPNFRGSHS